MKILRESWNPTYEMEFVLNEIKLILKNPDLDYEYCANQLAKEFFELDQIEYFNIWINNNKDCPILTDSDFESKIFDL